MRRDQVVLLFLFNSRVVWHFFYEKWSLPLGGAKGRILNGSRSPVTLGTIEVVALGSPTIKRMILISPTISTGIQTNQRSKIFLDNI